MVKKSMDLSDNKKINEKKCLIMSEYADKILCGMIIFP